MARAYAGPLKTKYKIIIFLFNFQSSVVEQRINISNMSNQRSPMWNYFKKSNKC